MNLEETRPVVLVTRRRKFELIACDLDASNDDAPSSQRTTSRTLTLLRDLSAAATQDAADAIEVDMSESDLVVQNEAIWRTLFPAPILNPSDAPVLYKACLNLGFNYERIRKPLLNIWMGIKTVEDAYHWTCAYAIHRSTLPESKRYMVVPKELSLMELEDAFSPSSWRKLVTRIVPPNGHFLQRVYNRLAADPCLRICYVTCFGKFLPHNKALLKLFAYQEEAARAAVIDNEFASSITIEPSSPPTGLASREMFTQRFDAVSHGIFKFPAIQALARAHKLLAMGETMCACLCADNTRFTDYLGAIWIKCMARKQCDAASFSKEIQSAFDAWVNTCFPGKRAFWVAGNTHRYRLLIEDVQAVFVISFSTSTSRISQISSSSIRYTHFMVGYDGRDVLTTYEGLQSWLTGRSRPRKIAFNYPVDPISRCFGLSPITDTFYGRLHLDHTTSQVRSETVPWPSSTLSYEANCERLQSRFRSKIVYKSFEEALVKHPVRF